MDLAKSVLEGNRLALTRTLTKVENDSTEGRVALDELFAHTGKAHLVGVTGAPGTGKSSLVNQLALVFRKRGKKIAIVAVDPSSPFTGGAVLGDRVRMRDLSGDAGVFIRSMASRGSLGGLAQSTAAVTQVFDAAGFDIILVETVGAGQSEVDIARLAHTTLVVEAPGLGDDIQAIKAGILEIADILVVNKADRTGVENTERALKNMLDLAHPVQKVFKHHGVMMTVPPHPSPLQNGEGTPLSFWMPPIQRTVATEADGVEALADLIEKHAAHLKQSGEWNRRERARLNVELENLISATLMARFQNSVSADEYNQLVDDMTTRKISPWEAVERLIGK